VDTQFFTPGETPPQPYFLVVSALVPYKRIDVAIRAALRLGVHLKIVGTGPDRTRLQQIAGPSIEFLGSIDPVSLREEYQGAQALVLPAEEDFGIAPVEAMACGRPVVALGRGGAVETVVPGVTGLLVDSADDRLFAEAMRAAATGFDDPAPLVAHAAHFSVARFETGFTSLLAQALAGAAC
jgi:glycosyltransferase involved in cell wall biosynthesis